MAKLSKVTHFYMAGLLINAILLDKTT